MLPKPFYLTSEFWITIATIVTALAGLLPVGSREAVFVAGLASAAYAISRGLSKAGDKVLPVTNPALISPDAGDAGAAGATPTKP